MLGVQLPVEQSPRATDRVSASGVVDVGKSSRISTTKYMVSSLSYQRYGISAPSPPQLRCPTLRDTPAAPAYRQAEAIPFKACQASDGDKAKRGLRMTASRMIRVKAISP